MSFRARYQGTCPECCDDIETGDLLDRDADDRVVHVTCVDGDPSAKVGEVCPECWIELPKTGVCGVCE